MCITGKQGINMHQELSNKCVFSLNKGIVILFMDGLIMYQQYFTDKKCRNRIVDNWEIVMRNFYDKHVFWVTIEKQKISQ